MLCPALEAGVYLNMLSILKYEFQREGVLLKRELHQVCRALLQSQTKLETERVCFHNLVQS